MIDNRSYLASNLFDGGASTRHPMLLKSGGRTALTRTPGKEVSRERKREIIDDSVKRLASPKRTAVSSAELYNDDDLIFSIKMSKDEYQQYLKTKENYQKKSKTSKKRA